MRYILADNSNIINCDNNLNLKKLEAYLEIRVFVHTSSGNSTDFWNGSDIDICIWEQKQVDWTCSSNALIAQFGVEVRLRSQNSLKQWNIE